MKKVLSLFLILFMFLNINIFGSSNNINMEKTSTCGAWAHFMVNGEKLQYGAFESVAAEESAYNWYVAVCNDSGGAPGDPIYI